MSQTSKYEILYIIRPNIDEAAKAELVARFDAVLADNGAVVVESKDWAKRRFAQEIKDFHEGIYHLPFNYAFYFTTQKSRQQNWVVRQILLVRNYRQDFLYAKKRNPGYD